MTSPLSHDNALLTELADLRRQVVELQQALANAEHLPILPPHSAQQAAQRGTWGKKVPPQADSNEQKHPAPSRQDAHNTLKTQILERTTMLEQAIAALNREVERRHQVESALIASEQHYQLLYEQTPYMYFTLSTAGVIVSVNRFGADQLRYQKRELVGQSVFKLFDETDHQEVLSQLQACTRSPHTLFEWEIQKLRGDHTRIWVRERAQATLDVTGQLRILVACEDITERKRTEDQLHETTRLLHTLVKESALPIVSLDQDAHVTSWNQAATRLFGWSEEEVLGRELPYVQSGEEGAADTLWQEGARGKVAGPLELRRQRKDGTMLDLLLWPVFVYDNAGQLSVAVGLYVDQSDLKRAEAARHKSETRLQLFLDALDDLACEFDQDGRYLNVWTHREDNLPLPKHQLIGTRLTEVFEKKTGNRYLEAIQQVIATGQTKTIEYAVSLDGRLRYFSGILTIIPAIGESQTTVGCIVRDMTEQRRIEEQVRESEARWRALYEHAGVGIAQLNLDGRFIRVNPSFCNMLRYPDEKLLSLPFQDLTHPDDLPINLEYINDLLAGDQSSFSAEKRYRRSDGSWVWGDLTVSLIREASGTPAYFIAAIQHIDDRKQAEQQLREREQAIRSLLEATSHPRLILEERIQTVLELGCRHFGIPVGFVTSAIGDDQLELTYVRDSHATLRPGQRVPLHETYCCEAMKSNGVVAVEHARTSEWSQHPAYKQGVECYIGIALLDQGRPYGTIGFTGPEALPRPFSQADKDFLQLMARWVAGELARQKSEQALRTSELKFRTFVETTHDWVWEVNEHAVYTYASPRIREILGYEPAEVIGRTPFDLMPQDEARRVADLFGPIASAHQPFTLLENTNRHKDGRLVVLETSGTPIFDGAGQFRGYHGIDRDITDRKRTEDALQKSEERFKIAFQSSPNPVIITELASGRCLEVNDASLKLFGYEREEVIGQTTLTLGIWPTLEDRARFFRQFQQDGTIRNLQISLRTKDRKTRELLVSGDVIDLNGTPCLITVSNDITEHKQAEAALRESEERFAKAFRSSPYPMVISELESGLCLDANDVAAQLFGARPEELTGHTVDQLGLWPTPEHRRRFIEQLQQTGSVRNTEVSLHMKSGEQRTCLISAETIELNGTRCMVTIGLDVTEQRRAEQALRLTQTAVDRSADMAFWIDQSARFLYVNDAACQQLGYTRKELLKMTVADIDPDHQMDIWPAHWEELRRTGRLRFESRQRTKSGEIYPTEIVANFVALEGHEYNFAFVRNISERKRSYSLLQAAINSVADGLLIVDRQGTVTSVNQRFLDLWNIPPALADTGDDTALLDYVVDQLLEPETFVRKVRELYAHPEQESFDVLTFKDGRVFERYSRPQILDTELVGRVWSFRDVTEHKQAENALRASELRLQRFVADAPVGLCILDDNWRAISANNAFCELTGYTQQEIIGSTYALYTHPDDLSGNIALTEEFFQGVRSSYAIEKRYIRKSGEVIWVSVKATRIELSSHAGPLLLAAVHDITEQKLAMEEREQLSRDLHDNLLQALYAVGMQLEAGKLVMDKSLRRSKSHITQAVTQLNTLMLDVRRFITVLSHRATVPLDFGRALKHLIASLSGTGHVAPELDITSPVLSFITPQLGEQLLNITREALSNSFRHAHAFHRWVRLSLTDSSIRLVIEDDGIGFSSKRRRRGGHGLRNMAARAKLIHATFALESAPRKGTRITVDVPLKKGSLYE